MAFPSSFCSVLALTYLHDALCMFYLLWLFLGSCLLFLYSPLHSLHSSGTSRLVKLESHLLFFLIPFFHFLCLISGMPHFLLLEHLQCCCSSEAGFLSVAFTV